MRMMKRPSMNTNRRKAFICHYDYMVFTIEFRPCCLTWHDTMNAICWGPRGFLSRETRGVRWGRPMMLHQSLRSENEIEIGLGHQTRHASRPPHTTGAHLAKHSTVRVLVFKRLSFWFPGQNQNLKPLNDCHLQNLLPNLMGFSKPQHTTKNTRCECKKNSWNSVANQSPLANPSTDQVIDQPQFFYGQTPIGFEIQYKAF